MLTEKELNEIKERHKKVDADQRFTDKIAHRDRTRLLEHIDVLDKSIRNLLRW